MSKIEVCCDRCDTWRQVYELEDEEEPWYCEMGGFPCNKPEEEQLVVCCDSCDKWRSVPASCVVPNAEWHCRMAGKKVLPKACKTAGPAAAERRGGGRGGRGRRV